MDKQITPTTIIGIKRLAKRIKRERSIKYCEALDAAAQAALFEDYQQAIKELGSNKTQAGTRA